jgi:cytosine/adenosine deaminase-related metal-dependent hydrolase
MILMPGMTDGHRHVWQIIDAGRLAKTSPARYAGYQEWKMRTIVSLAPEDHYLAGLVGGLLAIDSGVTSIIDYAHGQINAETALAAAQGVKDSGISGWFKRMRSELPRRQRRIGRQRNDCRTKCSLTVLPSCN